DLPAPGPGEAMRRLAQVAPHAAVVVLAGADDTEALERALSMGARGFLTPEVNRAELAAVAAHVHAVSSMGPTNPAPAPREPEPRQRQTSDAERTQPVLTRRELEVLVGMSNGRSNAQIGQDLYLSEDTVKTHARRLFRKLGASDRAQAVAIGMRRGLIQ
ncbi:MAG: response regulator transcription factor, partial [Micrococcales bacterium]|nr:response regulator transcription factor [Micrococcales bacterium]